MDIKLWEELLSKENINWSKCIEITNILIFWNRSKLHRLPLCERLTDIENDLLMSFPEIEKVKNFNTVNKSFYKPGSPQLFRFYKTEEQSS